MLLPEVDIPEDFWFIPFAPVVTATGTVNLKKGNFAAGLQARYLGYRPANEDNSIVAEKYFVSDLNLGYTWDKINFGITIENLFDNDWNEAQFATRSRLKLELQAVEEIHFIPGTPFFLSGLIQYTF